MNDLTRFIAVSAFAIGSAAMYSPGTPSALPPSQIKNYSYAYWQNGWRKHTYDASPDILCFETGHYGLALDLSDFEKTRFGRFEDGVGYKKALQAGTQRMDNLPAAELVIELETGGRFYRAQTCRAGVEKGVKHLRSAQLWESGKVVQHFDLLDLIFKDNEGNQLSCSGTLDIVAWPDSLTLNLKLSPKEKNWNEATLSIQLNDWTIGKTFPGEWKTGTPGNLTLNCNLNDSNTTERPVVELKSSGTSLPVVYDETYNCHAAHVKKLKRERTNSDRSHRNYDEFDITVVNGKGSAYIPFLLNLDSPASITGLCPILCDTNGVPTGIPVQLSKNWHLPKTPAYLRAYALIPAEAGTNHYKLRIAYGFYGTLPSASHAQLCLVGWGNHGRWDQLAIGSWGETFCLDMDMSCTDLSITDVRMLMARNGLEGRKWNWTDAGWGGDWLNLQNERGDKLYFNELKTAYISHGPCLTEVHYDGFYGADRQVDLQSMVRTLRTDDYARTFNTLRYTFNKPVTAKDGWLFKMGRTGGYVTPTIAYGNGNGLLKEHRVPNTLDAGVDFLQQKPLSGKGPWWVAFPGAYHNNNRDWGTGSRALVIRSYRAVVNGKEYTNPEISFPVYQVHPDGSPNLDMLLMPPEGVSRFNPGDSIALDIEWITPHRIADDYYGPNESYRKHLEKYPESWKTVYREAKGNDLQLRIVGGVVKQNYPVIIQAQQPEVQLKITGGVGAVPVRFDGLDSPAYTLYQVAGGKRIKLDQSVHGNDFWQTDYDPASNSYSLTYNLLLDGHNTSGWILKADASGE